MSEPLQAMIATEKLVALPIDTDAAQDLADALLFSCGGRRVLHVGCGTGSTVRALLNLGIDAVGVDLPGVALGALAGRFPGRFHECVAFDALSFADRSHDIVLVTLSLAGGGEANLEALFTEIRRVANAAVYVLFDTSDSSATRELIESKAFLVGFRKHPAYYQVNAYEALEHEGTRLAIVLEPMSDPMLARYPLEALREERDLHMDMLREPGARSDAHVARYHWALSCVRPGDRVLDAACGLGYGSYLLQACSPAASTLGIDGSDYAIDYANCCFAARLPGLAYQKGFLPDALESVEDGSIDLIVSFETLEHVEHNERLLEEFHRVLSPGGRLIVSVPNDWSDETGKDPNPFHLHVYTLDTLRNQLSGQFVIEKLVAQSASRHKSGAGLLQWVPATRRLEEVSVAVPENEAPDAEWWLAIAMRSPLDTDGANYRESIFPEPAGGAWNVTAFARDYDNPWLPRGMVHVHHRLQEPKALGDLTNAVLRTAAEGSPDQGAALCVQAYQLLRSEALSDDAVAELASHVAAYIAAPPRTAQGVRWRISLLFVLGRLWMGVGRFEDARAVLEDCVALDPLEYSPLLGNRTVEAYLLLGVMSHVALEPEVAKAYWRSGVRLARRVLTADWREALGDCDTPADFGLPELASVLEHASSCAMALVGCDAADDKCGWWRSVLRNRVMEIARLTRLHGRALKDKAWHASQRGQWEQQARTLERQVADLESLERHLVEDKDWLITQRDAWESRAKDWEQQVEQFQKDKAAADDARAWLEDQRRQWEVKSGDLSAELVRMRSLLERCESDYKQACHDRHEQAARAEAADAECLRMQTAISWHDAQRQAWEEKATEAEQSLRVAQDALTKHQSSIDWLDSQRATWESKAVELTSELARLQSLLERCQSDYQAARVERNTLTVRVDAAEAECLRMQADIAWHDAQRQAWEEKAAQAEQSLCAAQGSLADRQTSIDWLEEQRATWESKAEELTSELSHIQSVLERCQLDYQTACKERDLQTAHVDAAEAECLRMQADIAWHDVQRRAWEEKAAQVEQSLRASEDALTERQASIDWLEDQRAAWEGKTVELTSELSRIQSVLERCQSDYQTVSVDRAAQTERADRLAENVARQNVELAALRLAVVEKDAKQISLQDDVAWHNEQRQLWERNTADALKHISELENALQDRESAIEWHVKQSSAWETKARVAGDNVAHLQRDVAQCSENADKMQAEISEIQAKCLLQEEKIAALDAELESLNKMLLRLRSKRLIKLINYLFRNKYF